MKVEKLYQVMKEYFENGKEVQYKFYDDKWKDARTPSFDSRYEWRVKPEKTEPNFTWKELVMKYKNEWFVYDDNPIAHRIEKVSFSDKTILIDNKWYSAEEFNRGFQLVVDEEEK